MKENEEDFKIHNLFPTSIITKQCNLNLKNLHKKCKFFEKNIKTKKISNQMGAYQGHNFKDRDLENLIKKTIKRIESRQIKNYYFYSWVNINYPNTWNCKHNHIFRGSFLSGVFYIKVPPESGNIIFHDPRSNVLLSMEDMRYYDILPYFEYTPKENELLLFPSWLEHEVSMNNSNEERISIAFNISEIKL